MQVRALAAFALFAAAASLAPPASPARGEDKIDVLCGGDLDICKMTSELLQIRLDVLQGVTFEEAARDHAPWAWRDGGLVCVLGTTGNTPELLQACTDAGLAVVKTFDLYGVHNVIVNATGISGLEAVAHRPEVRGITVASLGTSNPPPPPDPAKDQRLRLHGARRATLRYTARADWSADEVPATLPLSIRVGDVEVVSGELLPQDGKPGRWVLRTGTRGQGVVVSLDDTTGMLRLRATGIDLTGIDRAAGSLRVSVQLGTGTSNDDLAIRRRVGGRSTWRSER